MKNSIRTAQAARPLWRRSLVLLAVAGFAVACASTPTPPVETPAAATTTVEPPPAASPTAGAPDPTAAPTIGAPSSPPSGSPSATPAVSVFFPFVPHEWPFNPTPRPPDPPAQPPPTEPPPSPTPLPWPDPIDGQTASKLSVHTLNNGEPYVMEFVRRVKPRVIKAVGDVGWLKDVKAVSPQTVTLGRTLPQQDEWILTLDPVIAGQSYVDLNLETYRANPFVDYWEGWNEFVPVNAERMQWFATFEATRACTMQAHGFRAAVGGFSTGVPEYDLMAGFLPAIEAAKRCGGIFHLHEYDSPTFDCKAAVNVPNIIPGAPALSVPAGPLALRYRFWYEGYFKPRGLGDVPLIISELGIDGILPSPACDDSGGGGWKDYQEWWIRRGFGTDGPRGYVKALEWYDAEMRRDPYVLGAALFATGALDTGSPWHKFDLHDVLLPLAIYAAGQR
jgi:hypothetical protein